MFSWQGMNAVKNGQHLGSFSTQGRCEEAEMSLAALQTGRTLGPTQNVRWPATTMNERGIGIRRGVA